MSDNIIHHTHLTCPVCGFREELEIPADYCLFFHRYANCNIQIRPAPGDCCIFCSYGDTLCIPKQQEHLLDIQDERRYDA